MCKTCMIMRMTHMLQVRNVSAETLASLKQRAKSAGMSLSDYARKELERVVSAPTVEQLFEAAQARSNRFSADDVVAAVREGRDEL